MGGRSPWEAGAPGRPEPVGRGLRTCTGTRVGIQWRERVFSGRDGRLVPRAASADTRLPLRESGGRGRRTDRLGTMRLDRRHLSAMAEGASPAFALAPTGRPPTLSTLPAPACGLPRHF